MLELHLFYFILCCFIFANRI